MAQMSWRPAAREIREVREQLDQVAKPWAKQRLAILAALKKHPVGNDQEIAGAVGTRTSVVTRLLSGWRDKGETSVTQFGRPKDLDTATLNELAAALRSNSFTSLFEVGDWIKAKTKIEFSAPTLRAYCKQLGFDPSAWPRPRPIESKSPRQPRPQWTAKQKAELMNCAPALQRRAQAILKVGTTTEALKKISADSGVPTKRLRRDVKLFAAIGLPAVAAAGPGKNILLVTGHQKNFFDWCDSEYKRTSKCPTAEAAYSFLTFVCFIGLAPHGVYRHLEDWRKTRRIHARKYKPQYKIKKGNGVPVRSLRC